MSADDTLLHRTGQQWKLVTSVVVLCGGFGLMALGIHREHVEMAFAGMGVSVSSLLLGCLSVRCPQCGAPWLWVAMSTQTMSTWLTWLTTLSACPRCGKR